MEGAPMLDTTTFVGLDVHARSIKAVSLDVMTGEVRAATFGYDAGAVAEWVRSVDPRARCVYESGVTGFDLQWIGNTYLDDSGRDSPASLNSTGDM